MGVRGRGGGVSGDDLKLPDTRFVSDAHSSPQAFQLTNFSGDQRYKMSFSCEVSLNKVYRSK